MPLAEPGRPAIFWHLRAVDEDGRPAWLALVWSDRHPDGTYVELPVAEAEAALDGDAVCIARYDDGAVTGLQIYPVIETPAPPLWFAELAEPDASPPATVLVAFSGHGVEEGTLLDRAGLADVPVKSADQLGAIRWYPATGEVDQVYVSPAHRRRHIGSALIAASGTLGRARGWPPQWGDGQRTADGERWRNASPWAKGAADLTHLAPPMTPMDQRDQVRRPGT
jgi:GNAT superfamily N-acetyltransferase